MKPEHEQFIREESQNVTGQRWLDILKALVDSLYNSRGKSLDKIAVDQSAAQVIEKELVQRLELGTEKLTPQKGDEYR